MRRCFSRCVAPVAQPGRNLNRTEVLQNQVLSGLESANRLQPVSTEIKFPDTALIIPCSIQRQEWLLVPEAKQNESLTAITAELGLPNSAKFPVFSLLAGNLGGEGLATDCALRHLFNN